MMKGELVGIMNVEGKEQRSKNELAKFRKMRQRKPNKLCGEKYALHLLQPMASKQRKKNVLNYMGGGLIADIY